VPQSVREAGERDTDTEADDAESEDRQRAVADGGTPVVMRDDEPPTVQNNPGVTGPC